MSIGAGIAKGIMGNQAKKDQFEENKQLMVLCVVVVVMCLLLGLRLIERA